VHLQIPNIKTNNFHKSNVEIHNLNREQKEKNTPNKKNSTKLETTLGVLLLINQTKLNIRHMTNKH